VVRHTNATRCHIELTTDDNATMLRVTNDGVTDEAPHPAPARNPRTGGRGLANLAARAEALGGRLSTHIDGDDFELAVQIPRPADRSPRPAVKDPFTASDPAHRIDEVGGRTVLDEEP
jgi:two-component system sensor histidine kinase DesK